MANINAPFGMMPLQPVLHTEEYRLYPSNATAIFLGDPIAKRADGTLDLPTAGNNNPFCGSVESIFDSNGVPVNYAPIGTGLALTVVVADDPNQLFMMQDDGDTTQLALVDEGANVEMVATSSGNTATGRSGWEIDSSSSGADANGQLRLIRLYRGVNNAIGANAIWICRINVHQNAIGAVGAAI